MDVFSRVRFFNRGDASRCRSRKSKPKHFLLAGKHSGSWEIYTIIGCRHVFPIRKYSMWLTIQGHCARPFFTFFNQTVYSTERNVSPKTCSKASAEFWICNVLENFALRQRFSFVSARHLFEMQANMVSQIGSSSNYAMHYHFQLAKEALPPRLCEWELSTRNMSPECCYTPTVCINNFAYPFLNEQFARLAPKRFGNAARRSLIKKNPRAG